MGKGMRAGKKPKKKIKMGGANSQEQTVALKSPYFPDSHTSIISCIINSRKKLVGACIFCQKDQKATISLGV